MHKVKSFARSKAHAHGYNPWSSDAGQQSATGTVELPPSRSPNRAARTGSLSVPDPNSLRNASAERRRVSPDPRRGSISSRHRQAPQQQEIDTLPTVPTLETVNTDRSVHFNPGSGANNTENAGEPPDNPQERKKPNILERFLRTFRQILFHSWVNILLVFVPIGIAVDLAGLDATIVFAMNAIAIVPLAGLLSYATESVAHRMGDTVGALMNVTFGNATELIVFIIALTKDEISVVQASIIGSVLSNLLLILGMSFLIGGLRFREQMYNSTVTQMSACLLSISALSLLLPTAFHASFSNADLADVATLKISRGTSVILLLVYVIYILFQLRSHAYLYASVPQHVIDEESHPGILHRLGTSSSSSSSRRSSISSSTSGGFAHSIRDRLRRMSQHDGGEGKTSARSSATATSNNQPSHIPPSPLDEEEETRGRPLYSEKSSPSPELIQATSSPRHLSVYETVNGHTILAGPSSSSQNIEAEKSDAQEGHVEEMARAKRSLRAMGKLFTRPPGAHPSPAPMAMAPGLVAEQQPIRPLARRATSLPPRLSDQVTAQDMLPYIVPLNISEDSLDETKGKQLISRTSAVILLLCTTALVAVCAEFLVSSIDEVISTTGISEAFVGLILLPIIGNAAEHVTAVTVAAKNKMDLAIGVAVGSSIQIAIFVTPLIVLLGWILDKDMGLYFNIFETVSLFASCFVVNFLVLDGRSNYLEGALLCAGYVIIAVAAFFYPNEEQRSPIGSGSK